MNNQSSIAGRVANALAGTLPSSSPISEHNPEVRKLMARAFEEGADAMCDAAQKAISAHSSLPERGAMKSDKEQGMYRKFEVRRTDGRSEPGEKHHGCEYFVLDVDHDPYAKGAILAYAILCTDTHPQLSADLLKRFASYFVQHQDKPACELVVSALKATLDYLRVQ